MKRRVDSKRDTLRRSTSRLPTLFEAEWFEWLRAVAAEANVTWHLNGRAGSDRLIEVADTSDALANEIERVNRFGLCEASTVA